MGDLPVYMTEQTEEKILQRMKEKIPADYDKSEGSFVHDFLTPSAIELAMAGIGIKEALRRGFATTAASTIAGEITEELTKRAAEHGVIRKEAVKAAGTVIFSGIPNTVIPSGTKMSTAGTEYSAAILFQTIKEGIIGSDGQAEVEIQAIEAGSEGNVGAMSILYLETPVQGVTSVQNAHPTGGGREIEDDVSLLPRYLAKVRNPSTGGNKADYMNWALEVPGVKAVRVFPAEDGNGIVRVVITNGQDADPQLEEDVAGHIEGLRPIGAKVEVTSAVGKVINVNAEISLASGYSLQAVKDTFSTMVNVYLEESALKDTYLNYSKIANFLFNTPGVLFYTGLTLNGVQDNLPIGNEEIPVLGAVELEVLP